MPLDDDALEAIVAWVKSRPPAATEHLLLSMPRAGAPGPLGARDIARIVGRHADIRTTTVYTAVNSARLIDAVDERQRQRRGISRTTR